MQELEADGTSSQHELRRRWLDPCRQPRTEPYSGRLARSLKHLHEDRDNQGHQQSSHGDAEYHRPGSAPSPTAILRRPKDVPKDLDATLIGVRRQGGVWIAPRDWRSRRRTTLRPPLAADRHGSIMTLLHGQQTLSSERHFGASGSVVPPCGHTARPPRTEARFLQPSGRMAPRRLAAPPCG